MPVLIPDEELDVLVLVEEPEIDEVLSEEVMLNWFLCAYCKVRCSVRRIPTARGKKSDRVETVRIFHEAGNQMLQHSPRLVHAVTHLTRKPDPDGKASSCRVRDEE